MVIVSDSSCEPSGFRYGLTAVLREAGIFVVWTFVKLGAKAKELALAWEKAPGVDIGLTIYNGNDLLTNNWERSLADDVNALVEAAKEKCKYQSLFFPE